MESYIQGVGPNQKSVASDNHSTVRVRETTSSSFSGILGISLLSVIQPRYSGLGFLCGIVPIQGGLVPEGLGDRQPFYGDISDTCYGAGP